MPFGVMYALFWSDVFDDKPHDLGSGQYYVKPPWVITKIHLYHNDNSVIGSSLVPSSQEPVIVAATLLNRLGQLATRFLHGLCHRMALFVFHVFFPTAKFNVLSGTLSYRTAETTHGFRFVRLRVALASSVGGLVLEPQGQRVLLRCRRRVYY